MGGILFFWTMNTLILGTLPTLQTLKCGERPTFATFGAQLGLAVPKLPVQKEISQLALGQEQDAWAELGLKAFCFRLFSQVSHI